MKGNPMKRTRFFLFLCSLILAVSAAGLQAENKQVKIALSKIENLSMDPRYDYLEGILTGTLLFDLGSDAGILIVDRSSLDAILREQELALSDLANAEQAVRVGRILGADYLLKGDYIFLGTEVQLNISLVEVETAKTLPFKDRGSTENLVHGLAERIIERLTGKTVKLRSDASERSIISLKDEIPGTIVLFCNLIRAEIFIDDEFVSYTTGKATEASVFEDIRPGEHTVRVRLSGFGVVKQPELICSDWQEKLTVKPGKKHVLRASIGLLNWTLGDLKRLFLESKTIRKADFEKPFGKEFDVSFVDRKGKKHAVTGSFSISFTTEQATLTARVAYDGKEKTITTVCATGKKEEHIETFDLVDVKSSVDYKADQRCYLSFRIERNDFDIDVWREQQQ
jgi:TolB-like protein